MVYGINGNPLATIYNKDGGSLQSAYAVNGSLVFSDSDVDYSKYSYTQKWASKGVSATQGLDIYDGKVFWVQKSGNDTIPSNCYVWNLSDGSQALNTAYITVYCGHGNNLCFNYPLMYATSGYTPHVYVNTFTSDFVATLIQTLYLNDGCIDCDACLDDTDDSILWSLGHVSYTSGDPFLISKWDLTNLTDNGDGTFTPEKLQTIQIDSPSSRFFQGIKFHDGLLWYGNGEGGVPAYIRAVNPDTGIEEYVIDLETTAEPEGHAWVAEQGVVGGYALYVGFQGMALRRYTFGTN